MWDKRKGNILKPHINRVLLKSFEQKKENCTSRIISQIIALSKEDSYNMLEEVKKDFSIYYNNLINFFNGRNELYNK